jgi:hypothetical protein
MMVELIDDFFAEHPATTGEADTIDTDEVVEARRSAVPLASVTIPATAKPCRFSMVAWPI